MEHDPRPIGIFDSGVGGLTVLRALLQRFPAESFIYLGDTARVPYGTKSARTVERYTIQVGDYLLRRGVKGLVVACNTASALGLPALRDYCHQPVIGVIEPGCRSALAVSLTRRVGVIGTRSMVASRAYVNAINHCDPAVRVVALACPLFVPLVEEGWVDHPATRMIVAESLAPLAESGIDTLIMGCTHYPILKPVIQTVMGAGVRLVDSADAVADELAARFQDLIGPSSHSGNGQVEFLVTDATERFQEVAQQFLGSTVTVRAELIDV